MSESWSVSNSVDAAGNLYVVWADFRNNTNQGCTGSAMTATSVTTTSSIRSRPTRVRRGASRWSSSIDRAVRRKRAVAAVERRHCERTRLWIAFYDRSYGDCEATGCNDITMAEVMDPPQPVQTYQYSRVTTSSMPNLTTDENPIEAGFPVIGCLWPWMARARTRRLGGHPSTHGSAPETDVYYARVAAASTASSASLSHSAASSPSTASTASAASAPTASAGGVRRATGSRPLIDAFTLFASTRTLHRRPGHAC